VVLASAIVPSTDARRMTYGKGCRSAARGRAVVPVPSPGLLLLTLGGAATKAGGGDGRSLKHVGSFAESCRTRCRPKAKADAGRAGRLNVTTDQATVLRFLRDGFRLRVRSGIWLLKEPDYVDRFEKCPGGRTTIDELVSSGYIDRSNNLLTEAGRAALALIPGTADPGEEAKP